MPRRKILNRRKSGHLNSTHIDFVKQRYQLLQDQIDEFIIIQSQSPLSLLNYKGIDINSAQLDAKALSEQSQLTDLTTLANKCEREVGLVRNLVNKIEKELFLSEISGLAMEQKEAKRLQKFHEEWDIYNDFKINIYTNDRIYFNGRENNYQSKLFEVPLEIVAEKCINLDIANSYEELRSWMKDGNYSQRQQLLIGITDPLQNTSNYFKFDDLLNSLFIDRGTAFRIMSVMLQFGDNLSLLSLLRFLLTITSCNYLFIYDLQSLAILHLENIKDVLETIFFVIFSMKNLQALRLIVSRQVQPFLAAALKKCDLTQSNLQSIQFYFNPDSTTLDDKNVADILERLSHIPKLNDFTAENLVVSNKESEPQISQVIQKLKSVKLELNGIPRSFSFDLPIEKILSLKLTLNLESFQFTNDNFEDLLLSVKKAKHLFHFQFEENVTLNESTKDIKADYLRHKKEQEQPEQQSLKRFTLLDHLSELSNLKYVGLTCRVNQAIYDSLLILMGRNKSITKYSINLQNACFDKPNGNRQYCFQLKNIIQVLNNARNIDNFILQFFTCQIRYFLSNQNSISYTLLQDLSDIQGMDGFNPYKFEINNANKIDITVPLDSLSSLDVLCQSISTSSTLASLKLVISISKEMKINIERNPYCHRNLLFFHHLSSLSYLKHFKFQSAFDQSILESIESLIKTSSTLKSLMIKRDQLDQFYLNYSGLLHEIQDSKTIEQIYLQTQIDLISMPSEANRERWEMIKLKNYYNPAALLLKNAPTQLYIVDLDEEELNIQGQQLLLTSLNSSPHLIYSKYNSNVLNQINESQNQKLISLLNEASSNGRIVKPYYDLPLAQQFQVWC